MNRILQADVILALTRDNALVVWLALSDLLANVYEEDEIAEVEKAIAAVKAQCAKQGVQF
ncbi:hypothetical protein KK141_19490 [Dyella sp. LX-66]|uniref:hypothetical protein n=1 Tax=unclassified Dyella TaxID=2634549 RepID=UPI001BDF7E09|nr:MULTISPECIES: hypothetical protein [unclassified Dyella]MBT2119543.1 hypothetical protein [Dyella sp. LX-1]MBT2141741.1 hypothetical protein [Dyella sp. LX-66]